MSDMRTQDSFLNRIIREIHIINYPKSMLIGVYLLFALPFIQAQDNENSIYLFYGCNIGNNLGGSLSINYGHNNGLVFQLGLLSVSRISPELPKDYHNGIFPAILLPWWDSSPRDFITNFYVSMGLAQNLSERRPSRLIYSFGFGISSFSFPVDFVKKDSFLGKNYNFNYAKKQSICLILSTRLEFPWSKVIGMSINPEMHLSPNNTYIGLGLGLIFGKLNRLSLDEGPK